MDILVHLLSIVWFHHPPHHSLKCLRAAMHRQVSVIALLHLYEA